MWSYKPTYIDQNQENEETFAFRNTTTRKNNKSKFLLSLSKDRDRVSYRSNNSHGFNPVCFLKAVEK